jgi:hypothetical protein
MCWKKLLMPRPDRHRQEDDAHDRLLGVVHDRVVVLTEVVVDIKDAVDRAHHHAIRFNEVVAIFGVQLEAVTAKLSRIVNQNRIIMTNQEHLDAAVSTLREQFGEVQAEVAALKAAVEAGTKAEDLDFSGLDAIVQSVSDEVVDEAGPVDPDGTPPADPEPGADAEA